mmetsp:Transcript_13718/g.51310  ORF Transcript_13718/g.51310 Transcript_13718/m.51310 type:complete len:367 (-) Transcript_13718:1019-2119(-)
MPFPKSDGPNSVWQDREIKFDVHAKLLALRPGEIVVDVLAKVEDTKGNNGDGGSLTVTNLRLIWRSARSKTANLSVGLGTITSMHVKQASSRLRGATDSLYVMTKCNGGRFEFIFTNLEVSAGGTARRSFLTVQHVQRSYDATKLFRELKLRGALISNEELKLLKGEEVYNKIGGVANLSNQRGNDGVFHLTNVRLVWHAEHSPNFNASIPYTQMASVSLRDSKFGKALVVTTSKRSGGYVLGFKVDDEKKLNDVFKEVEALHRVFTTNPVFGVDVGEVRGSARDDALQRNDSSRSNVNTEEDDDVEIIDSRESGTDLMRKYYAEIAAGSDGHDVSTLEPVFDETLGLAIEPLPQGATTTGLWNIV